MTNGWGPQPRQSFQPTRFQVLTGKAILVYAVGLGLIGLVAMLGGLYGWLLYRDDRYLAAVAIVTIAVSMLIVASLQALLALRLLNGTGGPATVLAAGAVAIVFGLVAIQVFQGVRGSPVLLVSPGLGIALVLTAVAWTAMRGERGGTPL